MTLALHALTVSASLRAEQPVGEKLDRAFNKGGSAAGDYARATSDKYASVVQSADVVDASGDGPVKVKSMDGKVRTCVGAAAHLRWRRCTLASLP